jgi:excisionase family DNA binding protein
MAGDTMNGSDLLRPQEAAQVLGVTAHTLAVWARAGVLASVRLPGGTRRYRSEDVAALLAQARPT